MSASATQGGHNKFQDSQGLSRWNSRTSRTSILKYIQGL